MILPTDNERVTLPSEPWPISEETRTRVMETVVRIATEGTDPREQMAAVRTLLAMDAQNLKWHKLNIKRLCDSIRRIRQNQ